MQLGDDLWRHLMQHQGLVGEPTRTIVRGEGCYLEDNNCARFLDAVAGMWCVNVGYGRRELADVAAEQMEKLSYLAPLMANEPAIAFSAAIQEQLAMPVQVYFSCSGSEANEAAFKIARQYHLQSPRREDAQRYKILSRYRAYHGSTMGAMAATGQAERKLGYGPEPGGFVKVMPPYPYRANGKLTVEEHGEECVKLLEETIIHEGPETIAAFITEPFITGGGVLIPPDNYLPGVREVCDRYGILLIFDEVVSGFGRTGRMFGHEHWNTKADIFTFAKGLASGYQPIAATAARKEIFDRFYGTGEDLRHLRHVNTFGAHPVAAAVGLKNLEILQRESLIDNAAAMGERLRNGLRERLEHHPHVGEIRGLGQLNGVELVEDRTTKAPLADARVLAVLARCMQQGVFMGRNSNTVPGRCNVIVMSPPLIAGPDEVDAIVNALATAVTEVLA